MYIKIFQQKRCFTLQELTVDPADAGAAYVKTPDGCTDLQHVFRALMWEEADSQAQLQAADSDSDAEQQVPTADMYFLPNFQQVGIMCSDVCLCYLSVLRAGPSTRCCSRRQPHCWLHALANDLQVLFAAVRKGLRGYRFVAAQASFCHSYLQSSVFDPTSAGVLHQLHHRGRGPLRNGAQSQGVL